MEPNVLADPVITSIALRVKKTPAQIALAWAVQRGSAFLTTSTKPQRIKESFDISALPEDAMREIYRPHHHERQVQCGGADRRARIYSRDPMN